MTECGEHGTPYVLVGLPSAVRGTVDVHAHIDAPDVYGLVQDEPGWPPSKPHSSRPSAPDRSSATPS